MDTSAKIPLHFLNIYSNYSKYPIEETEGADILNPQFEKQTKAQVMAPHASLRPQSSLTAKRVSLRSMRRRELQSKE
jgi:hypothetical protein